MTYLDWAATAPLNPKATAAIREGARQLESGAWANPSSVHAPGRAARKALNSARQTLAAFFGVATDDLVFTSGGTESLSLALSIKRPCYISATEHAAVRNARPDARVIPVDRSGRLDLNWLDQNLEEGALVAVQSANNETGVLQDIALVAALVHSRDGILLADHVQAAGKCPIPRTADLVAVSGHKLGAPAGIGVLIARCKDNILARQPGGGQEDGLRGGTENLLGAIGFAAVVDDVAATDWDRVAGLQRTLEDTARRAGAIVIGSDAERLPNISNLWLKGVEASTQLMALDMAGVAVSQGAACSSGTMEPSPTLLGMGLEHAAREAIRVSFGYTTTADDIARFLAAWTPLAERARAA